MKAHPRKRRPSVGTAGPRRGGPSSARRSRVATKAAGPQEKGRSGGPSGPRQAKRRRPLTAKAGGLTVTEIAELEGLRRELERTASARAPLRWNADPDDVQRSVAQLVLTLVEFIRKLLERQAIRRMEAGTLTDQQTEDVGRALMQLEQTVRQIAGAFGIPIEDLNLDLGPVGKLI